MNIFSLFLAFGPTANLQAPPPNPSPTPAKAVLKRELKVGEESNYDFLCAYLTHGDNPGAVPNGQIATWKAQYKITGVSDGKANVAVAVTDFCIDGTRPSKNKSTLPARNVEMILDDKANFGPAKPGGPQDSNGGWFVWESVDLPGKELSSGDTWEMTFPKEAVLHSGERVPVKFLGAVKYNNHEAWALAVDVKECKFDKKFKARLPNSKDPVDGTSQGIGSMHLELYIDQVSGKYLYAAGKAPHSSD